MCSLKFVIRAIVSLPNFEEDFPHAIQSSVDTGDPSVFERIAVLGLRQRPLGVLRLFFLQAPQQGIEQVHGLAFTPVPPPWLIGSPEAIRLC